MQDAWNSNKKFMATEAREFKAVRAEITASLVDELVLIFGTTTTPKQSEIKDIIVHVHQEENIAGIECRSVHEQILFLTPGTLKVLF